MADEATPSTQVTNERTSTQSYFSKVRLIQDGELVDSKYTNRPHEDIILNLQTLANISDVIARDSLGEWSRTRVYAAGDIVSFLSEYFVSLVDDNNANMPLPTSAQLEDTKWRAIANSKDIVTGDFTYKKGSDSVELTDGYHPFTNGRALRHFTLEGGRRYTLIMMSQGHPFKDRFSMYLDFESQRDSYATDEAAAADALTPITTLPALTDISYPAVSYIECEVTYTGMKYSRNGFSVPEIRFHSVNDSIRGRDLDTANAYSTQYDEYGHYGVIMQSILRNDGLICVTLTPKWNCTLVLAGGYNISPYVSDELGSITGIPVFSVTYRVRPFGGDNGEMILTPFVAPSLITSKQAWDWGIVKLSELGVTSTANSTVAFTHADYPKVLQTTNRVYFDGDKDSTTPDGYNDSVSIDISKCFAATSQVVGSNYIKLF